MTTENPQVGTVNCPFHFEGQQVQARVKKSLAKNRLYIHCPACGLIQPTLPSFQRWVNEHASFKEVAKPIEQMEAANDAGPIVEIRSEPEKPEKKLSDLDIAWG